MTPEKLITVSIVETDREARETLVAALSHSSSIRCHEIFVTLGSAAAGIIDDPPDVALIDMDLQGTSSVELVAKLKQALPDLQILMLTSNEESELIFDALRNGASGYLLKQSISIELEAAITHVHAGGLPMSLQVARKVVGLFRDLEKQRRSVSEPAIEGLTTREQEILALLAKGYLVKEISDQLGMAFHTARTHLRHIYKKLHVQSRSEAILRYLGR
jgi:DNA-binding NarL/FixJ family response regulator